MLICFISSRGGLFVAGRTIACASFPLPSEARLFVGPPVPMVGCGQSVVSAHVLI